MSFAADRLVDWRIARTTGKRVAGAGPPLTSVDRARLFEDFAGAVPEAEEMVMAFTGLGSGNTRSRPWVMSRGQWVEANLRGFERLLDPLAQKLLGIRPDGAMAGARKATLGMQIGGLLGYLGRRVLGQYDVFLPPDDDGLIYFVGPNVVALERRFGFPEGEFRLWLSLHEVAHRVQFGGTPWLRGHLAGLMDGYLGTIDLDPKWLLDTLKRSVEEVRAGRADLHGLGWMLLFMTPTQRELVRQMQAVMSLLEGHSTFVMNQVAGERVPRAAAFHRTLHQRRSKAGMEKIFQKAIGFDAKTRQYGMGERFVGAIVERVGMDGFNRVWEQPANLPSMEEVNAPEVWVARVAAS